MEMTGAKTKSWVVLSIFLLATNCMQQCVHGNSKASCLFIFGDSYSENGNNNNRATTAKANYSPYGIDYKQGNNPTGRVTNGRIEADFVAESQGLSDIPPYANTNGSDIHKGVNYASAAAGIRPETGTQRGDIISLERQIQNHGDIYNRIVRILGNPKKAQKYLGKCVYYMKIGTNDYYDNYFSPAFPTRLNFTHDQYAADLVRRYSSYLKTLHDKYGARKVLLFKLGSIGCNPYTRATFTRDGRGCARQLNDAASLFDRKLESEVERLNKNELSSKAKFVVVNSETNTGFTDADTPCCPTVQNFTCVPNGIPCSNRDEFRFYDGIHGTENTNRFTAGIVIQALRSLLD
ncbi:GDSL esterase/lipase At5g45670 [Vigna radiata var. radiata]|uniref:GDSL esterase/lipase At5g45670 n=1 Tax=Vigna radiata var. radiata TaxID=3916 RepID=A0A1S3VIM3_VIGRR|nr:GDSL esterase/lipase At5g45670 [Vigna radiata var. radiata]